MHVHLVFVTTYRRGVLTREHHDYLQEVFATVCVNFGAHLTQCNGKDDHIHLLINYPPQVAVSRLVNSLTDVSSRRLRQQHQVRTHQDHLWSLVLRRLQRRSTAVNHQAIRREPTPSHLTTRCADQTNKDQLPPP